MSENSTLCGNPEIRVGGVSGSARFGPRTTQGTGEEKKRGEEEKLKGKYKHRDDRMRVCVCVKSIILPSARRPEESRTNYKQKAYGIYGLSSTQLTI